MLQAQFSNSLLLFSERGGFVFPDAPEGNTLCQPLSAGGPLVTNITVDVGPGGIKTTYKMDLYTPRFGKLHVQKEKAIAQITRERQKLTDQRNNMIRKGIGKAATSKNYSQIMGQYNDFMNSSNYWKTFMGVVESKQSQMVGSVNIHEEIETDENGNERQNIKTGVDVRHMSEDDLRAALSRAPDGNEAARLNAHTGSNDGDKKKVVDTSPGSMPGMTKMPYMHPKKRTHFYKETQSE